MGHQELIFSSQLVFCIPLIYLVFEQFLVALLFLDLLCEQDKQLLSEIRQGREKDPGVISLRKSLPVVLCSLCFSPPREPTICISVNASTRLCVHVSHSVVSDCRNPMDCSLPGSSVHGILQARILKWVAISFSKTLYLVLI